MDTTPAPFTLTSDSYDRAILHPAFRAMFGGTDFYNVGYWPEDAALGLAGAQGGQAMGQACARLVDLHFAADTAARDEVRRVLDVGCGLGATTARFAAAYPQAAVTGINFSARQIDHARQSHGQVARFEVMDATRLAFAETRFDRIFSVEAAMHFAPRRDFLVQARNLLAPGGRLVLTDCLAREANGVMPAQNVHATAQSYAQEARASGFQNVEIRDITAETVVPFMAHMQANGHANIARFFAGMMTGYLLVTLS